MHLLEKKINHIGLMYTLIRFNDVTIRNILNFEFLPSNAVYNVTHHPLVNPFIPTVPTCAVRETVSLGQHMLEHSCENATVQCTK